MTSGCFAVPSAILVYSISINRILLNKACDKTLKVFHLHSKVPPLYMVLIYSAYVSECSWLYCLTYLILKRYCRTECGTNMYILVPNWVCWPEAINDKNEIKTDFQWILQTMIIIANFNFTITEWERHCREVAFPLIWGIIPSELQCFSSTPSWTHLLFPQVRVNHNLKIFQDLWGRQLDSKT